MIHDKNAADIASAPSANPEASAIEDRTVGDMVHAFLFSYAALYGTDEAIDAADSFAGGEWDTENFAHVFLDEVAQRYPMVDVAELCMEYVEAEYDDAEAEMLARAAAAERDLN